MQPLIAEMSRRGHKLLITTREFSETIGLADRCGLDHTPIGAHGGKTMFGKVTANIERAARKLTALAHLVRSHHVSIAVSSSIGTRGGDGAADDDERRSCGCARLDFLWVYRRGGFGIRH